MNLFGKYFLERLLLAVTTVLTLAGFWNVYFGVSSNPAPHHHLHLATNLSWLFLLLYQVSLIGKGSYKNHRTVGLSILFFGPLLVATAALLAVRSAHKALVSGQGDFLIVQNVAIVPELGFIILLAFILKKRRKLHGYMLLSTAILFLGIAMFFTLPKFVSFETAGTIERYVLVAAGLLFFVKDFRNGWPMLMASFIFPFNELIRSFLDKRDLIDPLTEFVGSMNTSLAFFGVFIVLFALLAFIVIGVPAMQSRLSPRQRA